AASPAAAGRRPASRRGRRRSSLLAVVPHADVLDHHLVVRGRLDDEVIAAASAEVERVLAAVARDVDVVLQNLVIDADAELPAGFLPDVVVRVEADRADAPVAQRNLDPGTIATALRAADAAAFLAEDMTATVTAAIVALVAAFVGTPVEHFDVANLDLEVLYGR